MAEEETRDLTDSIAAAAARKPGDGRSMMRVKTGPQMVRRKVPRWVGKLRCFFLKFVSNILCGCRVGSCGSLVGSECFEESFGELKSGGVLSF